VIFISYSWEDRAFTRSMVTCLSGQGYLVWIDYQNLKLDKSLVLQITLAVWNADVFLLVDSPNSRLSCWVRFEMLLAKLFCKQVQIVDVPV
jgi:TIR domain